MLVIIFLALIGALAVAIILLDSLRSVVELIVSHLTPYFLPQDVQPLGKKYGNWAGLYH